MNNSITKTLIASGMMLGLIFSTTPTFALTVGDKSKNLELQATKALERSEKITEKVEGRKAKQEENMEKRCEKVNENINKRAGIFVTANANRLKHYLDIKRKFLTIADKLDKKGVNTTKLRTDASTLDEKVTKLASDQAALMAKLGESRQYQCGKSEGQFKAALEQVREAHKTVLADGKNINEFVRSVLWQDVKDIRSQIVKPTTTTTNTTQ